jgi:hypothetical protein
LKWYNAKGWGTMNKWMIQHVEKAQKRARRDIKGASSVDKLDCPKGEGRKGRGDFIANKALTLWPSMLGTLDLKGKREIWHRQEELD